MNKNDMIASVAMLIVGGAFHKTVSTQVAGTEVSNPNRIRSPFHHLHPSDDK